MADLQATLGLSLDEALADVATLEARLRTATGSVDVAVDEGPLRDAAAAAGELDDRLEDVTDQTEQANKTADTLRTTLKGLLAAFGVREALRGLNQLVNAASDLEEATTKAQAVFSTTFDDIAASADVSAESVGLARDQFLDAAGTFGNFFTAMGVGEEQAAEFSTTMIQLAADVASFNNLELEESLVTLRSGLAGEIEPLRRIGVSFNAAQVEAKAFELGLADVSGEVTEAAKLQARYALIVEQTSTLQGDFARTSEGLANQQRIFAAEARNAAIAAGELLLPAAKELVTTGREDLLPVLSRLAENVLPVLVEGLDALSPALGVTLDLFSAMAPALGLVVDLIEVLPDGLLAGYAGFRLIGGVLPGLATGLGRVAGRAGLGGLAASLGKFAAGGPLVTGVALGLTAVFAVWQDAQARAAAFRRRVNELTDAIRADTDVVAEFAIGFVGSELGQAASDAGLSFAELTAALEGSERAQARVLETARELGGFQGLELVGLIGREIEARDAATERIAAEDEARRELVRTQAEETSLLASAQRALDEQAETRGSLTEAIRATTEALREELNATLALTDPFFRLRDAQERVAEAQAEVTKLAKAGKQGSDEHREALITLGQEQLNLVGAAQTLAGTLAEEGESVREVTDRVLALAEAGGAAPDVLAALEQALLDAGSAAGTMDEKVRAALPGITTELEAFRSSGVAKAHLIGVDLAEGIASGIRSRQPAIEAAAASSISVALAAANRAAAISSPSQLFAAEIGAPISEGLAQGILDAANEPASAIEQVIDQMAARATAQLESVLGGFASAFGAASAQDRLGSAEADLLALREEQLRLPREIAAAERALAQERVYSRTVTAEEQVAIERAAEALKTTREEYRAGEASRAELAIAEQRYAEAVRASTADTQAVADAERELHDLRQRHREISDEVTAAEIRVRDAQLAVVRAQRALIEADAAWQEAGPAGVELFRQIAEQAGLSSVAIDGLIASYGRLAQTTSSLSIAAADAAAAQYMVQAGDTLSAIASAAATSVSQLVALNPQISNPNLIHPGQIINVPLVNEANAGVGAAPLVVHVDVDGRTVATATMPHLRDVDRSRRGRTP